MNDCASASAIVRTRQQLGEGLLENDAAARRAGLRHELLWPISARRVDVRPSVLIEHVLDVEANLNLAVANELDLLAHIQVELRQDRRPAQVAAAVRLHRVAGEPDDGGLRRAALDEPVGAERGAPLEVVGAETLSRCAGGRSASTPKIGLPSAP